jgi:hypothetical protein
MFMLTFVQKSTAGFLERPPPPCHSRPDAQIKLAPGLFVSVEEAEATDADILVMLSRGIAFAASEEKEPVVKRLYQEVGMVISVCARVHAVAMRMQAQKRVCTHLLPGILR